MNDNVTIALIGLVGTVIIVGGAILIANIDKVNLGKRLTQLMKATNKLGRVEGKAEKCDTNNEKEVNHDGHE